MMPLVILSSTSRENKITSTIKKVIVSLPLLTKINKKIELSQGIYLTFNCCNKKNQTKSEVLWDIFSRQQQYQWKFSKKQLAMHSIPISVFFKTNVHSKGKRTPILLHIYLFKYLEVQLCYKEPWFFESLAQKPPVSITLIGAILTMRYNH